MTSTNKNIIKVAFAAQRNNGGVRSQFPNFVWLDGVWESLCNPYFLQRIDVCLCRVKHPQGFDAGIPLNWTLFRHLGRRERHVWLDWHVKSVVDEEFVSDVVPQLHPNKSKQKTRRGTLHHLSTLESRLIYWYQEYVSIVGVYKHLLFFISVYVYISS